MKLMTINFVVNFMFKIIVKYFLNKIQRNKKLPDHHFLRFSEGFRGNKVIIKI